MKTMLAILAGAVVLVAGLQAVLRLAPTDPGRWDVDPLSAASPGDAGWLVRPEGGDARFTPVRVPPEDLLAAFDAVALATPRTERVAGSPAEGRITYITRSRVWGFPDYTTVEAVAAPEGASLAVLARLRFGAGDLGVNRRRVETWLDAVRRRLGGAA